MVDSEYQVTIKLKEPNNTFINKITQFRIVSPKAMAMENASDYLAKNSAGTGPFVLSERVDGGYTKMVRNENYWAGRPVRRQPDLPGGSGGCSPYRYAADWRG